MHSRFIRICNSLVPHSKGYSNNSRGLGRRSQVQHQPRQLSKKLSQLLKRQKETGDIAQW